jgi:peptide/nickel transport system permease protein
MARYMILRLVQTVLVILGAVTVVFLILRLSGDPLALVIPENATPELIENIRESYGFNDPLYVQYERFLSRAFAGDFGMSIRYNTPAMPLVLERLPATLELAMVSLFLSVVMSVPIGVLAAVKKSSIYDSLSMLGALLGQSIPSFWLGVMLILLFAVRLRVLPTSGRGDLQNLVLPSFSLAFYFMARLARVTRSCMLDVLGEDYIRTARAKGLRERAVIYRHAVKNASISVVTVIGLTFSSLIGGSIIVEEVFAWPGVGRLMVMAVLSRDYPLCQATVFVIAVLVALINLLVDFTYAYLDPRIEYG